MAKDTENSDAGAKRSAYPYYPLERVLKVAEAVRDLGGGRAEVQKSMLAHQLALDESSTAFQQLIGAAKSFGLLEGRGTYTLSELANEYFFPTEEHQPRTALLRALRMPSVFDDLIKRFDGRRLPSASLLTNIVHREYKVPESWASRVASLFASALRLAGVIDTEGFLRYDSIMRSTRVFTAAQGENGRHSLGPTGPGPQSSPATGPSGPTMRADNQYGQLSLIQESQPSQGDSSVWVYSFQGKTVRVETSADLPMELWRKLEQYVAVLKPAEMKQAAPSENGTA